MPPVVFLPMCADVLHFGHVKILEQAALKGDVTVLLMTDEAMRSYKREPAMSMSHRQAILLAMKAVKSVIPCGGPQCYLPMVAATDCGHPRLHLALPCARGVPENRGPLYWAPYQGP